MYNLSEYGNMIADKVRMDAYAYALKSVIKQESVVLDIGAATGIHALLACKFGARRVYAVESNEAIYLAQQLAIENGFADRIEFIHDLSTRVTLPEKADIIVSDLRGQLPLFGAHIPSIIDARRRHLAPGGLLIPKQDTLWVSLIEAQFVYKDLINPWSHPYGLSMEEAKKIVLNRWSISDTDSFNTRNILTTPQRWFVLDYASIESPNVSSSKLTLPVSRKGTAHGLLIWFDAELAEGAGFSNGPGADKVADVYGRGFFPLLEPVSLTEDDSVTVSIHADLVNESYVWRWHTYIHPAGEPQKSKADFKQFSDFDGLLNQERILERVRHFKPSPNKEGEIDRYILGKMNGESTLHEIAEQTHQNFSRRFKNKQDALQYVYELALQYMD
jgi:protein arginine N-methyltransferase 1